jgi:uncharacterized protein YndB with AHSA1/START domain
MLKWIKRLAIALVALVALLFAGGLALSGNFTAVRSTTIKAPADKVYALIADPRDPAMAITYSGPPAGAGAAWEWKSKSEGDGKMTFTSAEPGKRVAFDLYFPDFGTTSRGALALSPEGAGTQVSWTMNGNMGTNPLFRWIALFGDKMVGPDFEAGLANLKALAEKP